MWDIKTGTGAGGPRVASSEWPKARAQALPRRRARGRAVLLEPARTNSSRRRCGRPRTRAHSPRMRAPCPRCRARVPAAATSAATAIALHLAESWPTGASRGAPEATRRSSLQAASKASRSSGESLAMASRKSWRKTSDPIEAADLEDLAYHRLQTPPRVRRPGLRLLARYR